MKLQVVLSQHFCIQIQRLKHPFNEKSTDWGTKLWLFLCCTTSFLLQQLVEGTRRAERPSPPELQFCSHTGQDQIIPALTGEWNQKEWSTSETGYSIPWLTCSTIYRVFQILCQPSEVSEYSFICIKCRCGLTAGWLKKEQEYYWRHTGRRRTKKHSTVSALWSGTALCVPKIFRSR